MSIDQNQNLASVFELIADLLELLDENQFKISAYRNSARIFQGLTKPIEDLLFSGELKNITGIGKASIEKAKEYISTGKISYLEELTKLVPLGLLELLKIKGLGPKKVKLLWKNLNITSLGELEYACKENRLILLKGFGEKTQTNVLNYIEFLKKGSGKFLINKIFFEQSKFEEFLKSLNNISLFSPIGINRRFFEVYDSINYLISSNNHKNLVNNFKNYFNDIIYSNSKISAKLNDIVFNIYLTDNNSFYS
ncbi:MAG TPA: helix-hairpin-helix domain-containing protein, partial [Bacteroidota bacterium]|nr:helix-hairpin-helix domain-containing protein [Bacteroidota bacterium]